MQPGSGKSSKTQLTARRVRDVLRSRIIGGDYGCMPLPQETDLCKEFDASRHTIRYVLDLLRDEGLIERRQGAGTFVVSAKLNQSFNRLEGLAESFRAEQALVVNTVLRSEIVPASAVVAARLQVPAGTSVVSLERLRHVDGEPLSIDASYFPEDIGTPLLDLDLATNDIFSLIETTFGLGLGSASLAIEAVGADPTVADLLGVRAGAPLLFIERLTHSTDGRPIDLEFLRYRGDRLTFSGWINRMPVHANAFNNERVARHGDTPGLGSPASQL
jgi:GntR family transcriptional regulator